MKGYVYTLEVMLAVALIIVTVVMIFGTGPKESETEIALIKQMGFDTLHYLDQSGDLRDAVARGALAEIDINLTIMLPTTIVFDSNICRGTCVSSSLPENRTVVVIDYYIGSYRDNFINKKLRLWLWKKF